MKLPYSEGTLFLVPLRGGGYARGVVARVSPRGKELLGYFFGPCLASTNVSVSDELDPNQSVLRAICGDLGLINGEWVIIGKIPCWSRSEWPMPDFVRRDPLKRLKPILVRYSDRDPMRIETEYPVDDDAGLLPALVSGYGAIEIKLTKLIRRRKET